MTGHQNSNPPLYELSQLSLLLLRWMHRGHRRLFIHLLQFFQIPLLYRFCRTQSCLLLTERLALDLLQDLAFFLITAWGSCNSCSCWQLLSSYCCTVCWIYPIRAVQIDFWNMPYLSSWMCQILWKNHLSKSCLCLHLNGCCLVYHSFSRLLLPT